ncbi:competence protein ComEA [Flavivirga aquatica]|uniref:Competence protein ComEA n=1 Tax=Flavivirga aquatica TaxID=1849968 RepID=A0A1E5SIM1_9FLAO|nr:helix-hairpin-helix domain-containing protein [Flavivirga aquatica]OEJ98964.1 competence protein ComEA [Flavivirga aquatica]
MQNIKPHFEFTKQQRNGIFLLIILIVIFQCIYFFVDFFREDISVNKEELVVFIKEIDSLKLVELESRKPKIYPFNPNYITDFKGSTLGMTNHEIDRLLAYRKQDKWINSTKQFQEVTKVSDSLLKAISPYFKFPKWINNSKTKIIQNYKASKAFSEKQDLNKVTAQELQKISGIGKVLSSRIIKFRNKFKEGFIADIQLQDVYGLTPELIKKIISQFTVQTPRKIKKININTSGVDELVTIQHIDYDLAHYIVEQRQLREGYKSLDELAKVKGFPLNKIDIIKLYLSLD